MKMMGWRTARTIEKERILMISKTGTVGALEGTRWSSTRALINMISVQGYIRISLWHRHQHECVMGAVLLADMMYLRPIALDTGGVFLPKM
jgi:hypothetical protein